MLKQLDARAAHLEKVMRSSGVGKENGEIC
jgi:hypothetical protein